jgi:uncharacterized damage-inducible protein DinB
MVDPRRIDPEFGLGEREMLEAWLEYHRVTLLMKCEGLTDAQRKQRPVPTSFLSLHGLVRHMAEVERGWFQRTLREDASETRMWYSDADPDGDLVPIDDADWHADLAVWQAECEKSRRAAAGRSLDDSGERNGKQCTLRWIYVHMIEEYARHNGHADLIRELVDGSVGC